MEYKWWNLPSYFICFAMFFMEIYFFWNSLSKEKVYPYVCILID